MLLYYGVAGCTVRRICKLSKRISTLVSGSWELQDILLVSIAAKIENTPQSEHEKSQSIRMPTPKAVIISLLSKNQFQRHLFQAAEVVVVLSTRIFKSSEATGVRKESISIDSRSVPVVMGIDLGLA